MLYRVLCAGLFIRVYDSSKQDGTAACLDVLGLMIKPFISQILDNSVSKGCHLLNGVYVKPVTLSVLNLVHVCPFSTDCDMSCFMLCQFAAYCLQRDHACEIQWCHSQVTSCMCLIWQRVQL